MKIFGQKGGNINTEIANTYVVSNKRLTLVAVLGIVLGLGVYIFMNSMVAGFDRISNESIFKSTPHIRVYKDSELSQSLLEKKYQNTVPLIVNPKIVPQNNTIIDPKSVIEIFRAQPDVLIASPQVATSVFLTMENRNSVRWRSASFPTKQTRCLTYNRTS